VQTILSDTLQLGVEDGAETVRFPAAEEEEEAPPLALPWGGGGQDRLCCITQTMLDKKTLDAIGASPSMRQLAKLVRRDALNRYDPEHQDLVSRALVTSDQERHAMQAMEPPAKITHMAAQVARMQELQKKLHALLSS
jgi:hypothetical protein